MWSWVRAPRWVFFPSLLREGGMNLDSSPRPSGVSHPRYHFMSGSTPTVNHKLHFRGSSCAPPCLRVVCQNLPLPIPPLLALPRRNARSDLPLDLAPQPFSKRRCKRHGDGPTMLLFLIPNTFAILWPARPVFETRRRIQRQEECLWSSVVHTDRHARVLSTQNSIS